jgi:hypothetical protein
MAFRRTRCAYCKAHFEPERQSQIVHVECVEAYVEAQAEKRARVEAKAALMAAKVDRAEDRKKRDQDKDVYDLIAEADKAFGAFIRERDRQAGHPCISSGRPLKWSAGNQVDAGHYRSKGAASHLRYNEDNCHAQSKKDNRYGAGQAVEYRIKLIQRIGLERVEALESDNAVKKWDRDELRAIKAKYRDLANKLKKEAP